MSDQNRLEQLNEQYIAAYMNADVNWYRDHLTDDFICIESDGSVLGKPEFLQQTARGPGVAEYKLAKIQVRFYGDAALVQATGLWTHKNGSNGVSRYTDIYARLNGDWKCVSAQITRAPGT